MKNLYTLLFLSVFTMVLFLSCEDEDPIADALLYGGGPNSAPTIDLSLTLNRINGWYMQDGNHIYGLDIVIRNPNETDIYNVLPRLRSVSPSSTVLEFDASSEMQIVSIAPNASVKPDWHWYVDDVSTGNTIYIGNVFVILAPYVSSGQTYELTIDVTFQTEGQAQTDYELSFTKSFTTINNMNFLPI